ncbi:hypothetical protein AM1_B0255 (plasmid) [Acaryochloris marina MBIC11017]|uniref:Uncharacterized protein n=1 Tax=Acaryochloris marina (strain MBIC 11017) TaxID=329726 RepID=A8ZLE7_ACAM1|nr:hypothetical protein AM1_B0255 [Acaryochloris marina MBIC11017]
MPDRSPDPDYPLIAPRRPHWLGLRDYCLDFASQVEKMRVFP